MNRLTHLWYQNKFSSRVLSPFSGLFRIAIASRQFLYRHQFKQVTTFPVPVIVVGNLSVGGNGKTPFVIWLCDLLRRYGYKPGIVSRGYGGHADHYPVVVQTNSDVSVTGDEAVLLKRRTQCPVVVAPDRVAAIHCLLKEFSCDVVISDDGLQHYAMGRDIEIVVIDGQRRFGNGHCLPAGPLREPLSRLNTVDFVIANGGDAFQSEIPMTLNVQALSCLGQPDQTLSHEAFPSKTVHAIAGIGHPERFFQTLRDLNFTVIEHPFPDHRVFCEEDLNFNDDYPVIMTEKDAVKCFAFAKPHHWYLPIDAVLPNDFVERLLRCLENKK